MSDPKDFTSTRHTSVPFQTIGQVPIPTPPTSSSSNRPFGSYGSPKPSPKFVHPARRRGSADSYTSNSDITEQQHFSARSPSYSLGPTRNNHTQLPSSPGACLVIRSSSTGSRGAANADSPSFRPRIRQGSKDSLGGGFPGLPDLDFDVEPLSPYSYAPRGSIGSPSPREQAPISNVSPNNSNHNGNSNSSRDPMAGGPSGLSHLYAHLKPLPPSRKNSRDDYSHMEAPLAAATAPPPPPKPPTEDTTIRLHAMPKSMLLPMPDRVSEMKYLMDQNKGLMQQIRRALGEEQYAMALDLWTRTRRTEVSDHEWLRRSKYFLVERMNDDRRLWGEFCGMVGWDYSRDLRKDENGNVRAVTEYADRMGHMAMLEEEEE